MKPFGEQTYTLGEGSLCQDAQGNIYIVTKMKQKIGDYNPTRTIRNMATGNTYTISQYKYLWEFYPVHP